MIWILAIAAALVLAARRASGPPPEVERAQRADAAGQGRLPYGTHADLARQLSAGGGATAGTSIGRLTEAARAAGAREAPSLPGFGDGGEPSGRSPYGGYG